MRQHSNGGRDGFRSYVFALKGHGIAQAAEAQVRTRSTPLCGSNGRRAQTLSACLYDPQSGSGLWNRFWIVTKVDRADARTRRDIDNCKLGITVTGRRRSRR